MPLCCTDVVPPAPATDLAVPRATLMGVLAVAQLLHPLERDVQRGGQRFVTIEPAHDGGVVGRGVGERVARQRVARRVAERAVCAKIVEDPFVLRRVGDDADTSVVLGRRPDHGRAADVDELGRLLGRERVER